MDSITVPYEPPSALYTLIFSLSEFSSCLTFFGRLSLRHTPTLGHTEEMPFLIDCKKLSREIRTTLDTPNSL